MLNRNATLNVVSTQDIVQCERCPAACCRSGVIMPLSDGEAQVLQEAGTILEPFAMHDQYPKEIAMARKSGRQLCTLLSDCGNLQQNPDGTTRCRIWHNESYPDVCRGMKMGGFVCLSIQTARIKSGEDTKTA